MDYKLKFFHCPYHKYQPIVYISLDPTLTQGFLYCAMCRNSLSSTLHGSLKKIEEFLYDLYSEIIATEKVKFPNTPPKELTADIRSLGEEVDASIQHMREQKKSITSKINQLQLKVIEVLGKLRDDIIFEYDMYQMFLEKNLEDLKTRVKKHFVFETNDHIPLKLSELFDEMNNSMNTKNLELNLKKRIIEAQENFMFFKEGMTQDELISRLEKIRENIIVLSKYRPKTIFSEDMVYAHIEKAIITNFTNSLQGMEEISDKMEMDTNRIFKSDIVPIETFKKMKEQIWDDMSVELVRIRKVSEGGKDMKSLVEIYEKLRCACMMLVDQNGGLYVCYKDGRRPDKRTRYTVGVYERKKFVGKLESKELPKAGDPRKVYLANHFSVKLKDDSKLQSLNKDVVCFADYYREKDKDPVSFSIASAEVFKVDFYN